MKTCIALFLSCVALLFSSASFAWSEGSCGSGGCGYSSTCSYQGPNCECVDPTCHRSRMNAPCMSQGQCCEAFGNIGGLYD